MDIKRNELVDFLRGGAMIFVLLHHAGFPLGNYILSFHMPLFFVISGYVEYLRSNKNVEELSEGGAMAFYQKTVYSINNTLSWF